MKRLVKIQETVLVISSILVLIGLFLTVLLRYVFKIDLFGIEELLLLPIFLLYFIGAANGSYEDSHISANMIDSYLKSEKIKLIIKAFTTVVTLGVCVIISYWSTEYLIWSFSHGGATSGWQIPLYIPHGTVLLGFLLMTLYSFTHLYTQINLIIHQYKN